MPTFVHRGVNDFYRRKQKIITDKMTAKWEFWDFTEK